MSPALRFQASACRTTITITGTRIRMSAFTSAKVQCSADLANMAKNDSIIKLIGIPHKAGEGEF